MFGFGVAVFVIFTELSAHGYTDLTPEAITVYRNPEFFKNLNYGDKVNYNEKSTKVAEEPQGNYKYPGETKKPNPPPASPGFEVSYDNSPEFRHEPRDIFVDTSYKPGRRKGPYGPKYRDESQEEENSRESKSDAQETVHEKESEEESTESKENEGGEEEPRDFVSMFNETPEEFQAYHEPILIARPNFDPEKRSGLVGNTYGQPYPYNRTRPILYDEWKFYTYPKIYSNEHLKSDSKTYSEEPSSNSFEDDVSSSNYRYDDETDDASNFFEPTEFRNLGADTKHIYKKLLKPKKSFLLKFHSKPKLKKLKFKLKKHLPNTDWFDEYPFNF